MCALPRAHRFVAVVNAQAAQNATAGAGGKKPAINLAYVFHEAAKPVNIFKADMSEALRKEAATLLKALLQTAPLASISGGDAAEGGEAVGAHLEAPLRHASERSTRLVSNLVEAMDDALLEAHRAEARATAAAAKLKLEATRASALVRQQNAAAELEATFRRQLEEKLAQMASGEASALAEAHARIEAVEGELRDTQLRLKGVQEALAMAQQLSRAAEVRESMRGPSAALSPNPLYLPTLWRQLPAPSHCHA